MFCPKICEGYDQKQVLAIEIKAHFSHYIKLSTFLSKFSRYRFLWNLVQFQRCRDSFRLVEGGVVADLHSAHGTSLFLQPRPPRPTFSSSASALSVFVRHFVSKLHLGDFAAGRTRK